MAVFLTGVTYMSQGTLKKLVSDKGFGFIEGEGGDDVIDLAEDVRRGTEGATE